MDTTRLKLVTIIGEAVLEDRLTRELRSLGALGYSVGEVRGEGSRGVRASDWEGRNIRIETVTSASVADAIFRHLAEHYFAHYAVIAFATDVEVLRGEKYV